jgi:NADH-quinone oxidoreductase subunit G
MTMARIHVEEKPYEVNAHQNLLHACLSLGFDLPYFCWHPALGSVGACRQCAVKQFKDEHDETGRLVMACMTPASDGVRISIQDLEAAEFRKAVIEGLMLNHPHDCPVCDEGGECHLQDMTVMTGHSKRVYNSTKRTFLNQYLGPFINHEMNRCIQCQRCVRYYREYAGDSDLNAFRLRDTVFFGRAQDGVLESEFSGNLVEVCPTGVFTDATLKHHYTRKWDLQMAPSVCVHCGLGCNTTVGERYGSVRRVVNRYNSEVNGYFLCDRGRFGYEFINSPTRIKEPLAGGSAVAKKTALERAGSIVREGSVIGIGSPRASLEGNYALRKLVGSHRFYAGVADAEGRAVASALRILRTGPVSSASLLEMELADAALLLGEDVTNVAPLMALRLRQSVRQAPMRLAQKLNIPLWLDQAVREVVQEKLGPLFIASPYATKLDNVATTTFRAAPDDIARLGFAVAHAIDSGAPDVTGLSDETRTLADGIAKALVEAERPVVVSGISCGSEAVLEAAAQVAWALHRQGRTQTRLAFTMPEANTFGLGLIEQRTLTIALEDVRRGGIETAIILENDLFRRAPSGQVKEFFRSLRHVIVLDGLSTPTSESAEVVFPAGTYAETDGTLVNNEGRAQRFFQAYMPSGNAQEGWRWIRDIAAAAGNQVGSSWEALDDVIAAMTEEMPALAKVTEAAPGRKAAGKIAREPERYSGRTSMLANITVHESKPPDDLDSALAFSMESGPMPPPAPLIPFFWSPGWNSIQATNKFQSEVGGPLRGGDPGARMVEPKPDSTEPYFREIPAAFRPKPGEWLICPAFHIFGSEELSRHSPGIAELAPKPCVTLNTVDAELLGIYAGEPIEVTLDEETYKLPAVVRPDLPRGVACLPAGLPPFEGHALPARGRLAIAGAALSMRVTR